MRAYYEAYEERYRAVHALGLRWAGERPTPIVADALARWCPDPEADILEIGCGEGRDAAVLLDEGRKLTATDCSPEAIAFCRRAYPAHAARFAVLDCLRDSPPERYDFIIAVAVIHMLVPDADRRAFYRFLRAHLRENGAALVCSMGDGETSTQSDISKAFQTQEREHPAGTLRVAATSCRMVSFDELDREITESGLMILEQGVTEALPEFNSLMYAVVRPEKKQQERQI